MKRNKKILFIVLAFILMLGPAAAPTPVWAGSSGAADPTQNRVDLSSTFVGTGSTVTITASGNRQTAEGLADGDTRYVPVRWDSDETGKGGTFTLTGSNYTSDYTTSTAPGVGVLYRDRDLPA